MDAVELQSARAPLGLFPGSLVRRYFLLLVASTLVPLLLVGFLYDLYMRSLRDQFTGEQLRAQLAATAGRLAAFLEARSWQLETLARYPAPAPAQEGGAADELASLARIEADGADLYGVLIFADDGRLRGVVPGQAASGAPYWADAPFAPEKLPHSPLGEAELIGPRPPESGQSGWFLVQEPLRGGGRIALQVRLASLTELLGTPSIAGVLEPVLRTPAGLFDLVGRPAAQHGQLVEGPEIAAGWRPCLLVDPEELLRPFQLTRYALIVGSLVAVGAIAWVSARLAGRLKHRVETLAAGAEMIAAGDFTFRVSDTGPDEIGQLALAFNRMASRLAQTLDTAVQMERMAVLGQFSTGVAHEVRNPLATLKTTVQALSRLEKDPQRAALLAALENEIDRMSRNMGEILAFGRPRAPERRPVRLREAAGRLETLVAPEAQRRQIGFALQGDLEATALVDPDHLSQILINLVLNALQATPAGGLVSIRGLREGEAVILEVHDTGCGVGPEVLRRAFEPFFTTKPGGTGLGLAISRQLARLNGGSLDLTGAPGQGTTARLVLRAAKDNDGERPDRG